MKKKDFFSALIESLDLDVSEITEETNLKDLEDFDSLAIMALIAFADEKFRKTFNPNDLASITTVKDLMDLIGNNNFE